MMKRLLLTFKTLETMGFFSWKTNDTEKSIANVHSYMEAFESGEKEKLLQAQEMLNEAQTDLKHLNIAKSQIEE